MSYLPLCQFHLQHSYFSSGYLQQAQLLPSAASQRALRNAQLLFKPTKQGAMLLLDSSRADIAAACCQPALTLYFLLYSRDALFGSYTAVALQQGQLWYCDSRSAVKQDGLLRLHTGAELDSTALIFADDARLSGLAELTQAPLPQLVLAVTLQHDDITALTAEPAKHYLIKFGSRRSIWRYYLCGDNFAVPLRIRDLTQAGAQAATAQFVQQADVTLANGRRAKVFDSTDLLALAQQSPYRLALVSQGDSSEKVLIKRLPVAAAGQLGTTEVNGVKRNLAEIYLNY